MQHYVGLDVSVNETSVLPFELLNESSKTRRDWSREGVVLVLEASPDC
jgi:hypothetical protein